MPRAPRVVRTRRYSFRTSRGFMQAIQRLRRQRRPNENLRAWMQQLTTSKEDLQAMKRYVSSPSTRISWQPYRNPASGKTISLSRRRALVMIRITEKDLYDREQFAKGQWLRERRRAAKEIGVRRAERAGDGNCYIQFINVGLGDCTVISSPKGIRFLIDLGSDSLRDVVLDPGYDPAHDHGYEQAKKQILQTIRSQLFLGAGGTIHFVILTHPDKDHHNLLGLLEGVQFGRVYYSGKGIEEYWSPSYYIANVVAAPHIKQVNLYQDKGKSRKSSKIIKNINGGALRNAPPNGTEVFDNEYIDPKTGAIVLYHEQDTGFKVSLLSGNVEGVYINKKWVTDDAEAKQEDADARLKGNGTEANKRCLVTLIEFNGHKVIITGDATAVTERFIADQFEGTGVLESLTVFRIGHHGSLTSSSAYFVSKLTHLRSAVASTSGKYTQQHGLPKYEILNLFPTPAAP